MKNIILTKGYTALVDDEDYNFLNQFSWYLTSSGYAARTEYVYLGYRQYKTKTISMHRLILNAPKELKVDHVNGNRLDNRKENIRLCNNQQNSRNANIRKDNTSGYKGVHLRKDKIENPYISYIRVNGNRIHLGYFPDRKSAAQAYNQAAKEYHGAFGVLNPL